MRYLLVLIGVFFLVGCTGYDYRIDKMPSRSLSYKQLPERVQKTLVDWSRHLIEERNGLLLLCDDNDSNKYQTKDVPFIVGIYYIKLIDTSNNTVYRIEQGTPLPYILYKDKLYIADDFNFYFGYDSIHYSEYNLSQE
jgi:hypothetical protein